MTKVSKIQRTEFSINSLIQEVMKKVIIALAILMGVTSYYGTTQAQSVNISINIGRQPAWGPIGYDYAGYYYFPDIDCYYDVNIGMFYYMDRGRWISARYLPYAYRSYDLYRIHKVVINTRDPWRYHNNHYRDYARYRGHRGQVVIRDSRDLRYRESRNNRVAWYSSDKSKHHNKDNKYRNDNRRPNNNSKEYRYNDNRNKNNDRYSSKDNNKNYNKHNNKGNSRPQVNKDNNGRNRGNNKSTNPSKNQERNKSKNNEVRQSSNNKSSEYRLASNSGRNNNGRSR